MAPNKNLNRLAVPILFVILAASVACSEKEHRVEIVAISDASILLDGGSITIDAKTDTGESVRVLLDQSLDEELDRKSPVLEVSGEKIIPGSKKELNLLLDLNRWIRNNAVNGSFAESRDLYFSSPGQNEEHYTVVVVGSLLEVICLAYEEKREYSDLCSNYIMPANLSN